MQSQIKAIKLMINNVGEGLAVDRALRTGMLAILDTIEPEWPEPEPEPEPKQEPKKTGRPKLDTGKMVACRKAGWSIAKIADEMGCTQQTVANHLHEAGVE